jgi:hypothetical protein
MVQAHHVSFFEEKLDLSEPMVWLAYGVEVRPLAVEPAFRRRTKRSPSCLKFFYYSVLEFNWDYDHHSTDRT